MFSRKSRLNQFHIKSGKGIINILLLMIVLWMLARPVAFIGQNIFYILGSITNNIYQIFPSTKVSIDQLVLSKKIINAQSKKIVALELKNNRMTELLNDVKELKILKAIEDNINYKTITAKVIGRSADNWHKQIILNVGKNANVKVGNTVLSRKGVIGQVVEVGSNFSVVHLISDPTYKLGCNIRNKNIIGILSGKTNSRGRLHYVPVGSDVMLGDIVETSGISATNTFPNYPKHYPVGRICKIKKGKRKSSDLNIEVRLFENLQYLSDVIVFSPN